jgi:hypothetical protein
VSLGLSVLVGGLAAAAAGAAWPLLVALTATPLVLLARLLWELGRKLRDLGGSRLYDAVEDWAVLLVVLALTVLAVLAHGIG